MKEKPMQGYNFIQDEQDVPNDQKEPQADGSHWFERIPTDGIPFIGRPQGNGIRYNFTGYSNLSDIAKEIKEASPHRFKHTGDVHRHAHYIGMYILRQMHVKTKSDNEADKIITASNVTLNKASEREIIRGRFKQFYDNLTTGVLTIDEFNDAVQSMLAAISSDETRAWFKEDVRRIVNDETENYKSFNRTRMRKVRALENMQLIDDGGNYKNNNEGN